MGWKLTVRAGPAVKQYDFDALEPALQALQERGLELADGAPGAGYDAKFKRFEPGERVVARLELAGPERFLASRRGGVDVRGDGSVEAYRGRVRRRVIEARRGESAYAALGRALSQG